MYEDGCDDRDNFENEAPKWPPDNGLHEGCEALVGKVNDNLGQLIAHGGRSAYSAALNELERTKASFCAAQIKMAYLFEKEVVRDHEERGVFIDESERGAASAVAMSRRQPPTGARSYMKSCRILVEDMPNLLLALDLGDLSERQIFAATSPLQEVNAEHRREFDQLFRTHPEMFEGLGVKAIGDTVRKFTERFESTTKAFQAEDEASKRYSRFRKSGNCVMLSAKLPLAEGTALCKSIKQRVNELRRSGDPRTKDQLMADMLICSQIEGFPPKLPLFVDIKLIMTDKSLLMGDREPANLPGYGIIPSQYARELVAGAQIRVNDYFHEYPEHDDLALRIFTLPEIQRLYTAPGNQDLIAMDSKAREFPDAMKEFIKIRDVHCRTPYCDGIIENVDHVMQHYLGGPTNVKNADGRCQWCNLAKEQPGWFEIVVHEQPHSMRINPGDGAIYQSLAPPATGVVRDVIPPILPYGYRWQRE